MFHSQCTNNKINKLHERALRIVYNDVSTFAEFFAIDKSFYDSPLKYPETLD